MTESIDRILVAVDLHEQSDEVFRYAAMLARRFRASIELLHVIEDPFALGAWATDGVDLYPPDLLDRLSADAQRRLRDMKDVLAADGDEVQPVVLKGTPAKTIVDRAAIGRFDLIVMGTHGRGGLAHALMGSVAERVVQTAQCPVLTVRHTTTLTQSPVVATAAGTIII